MQDVTEMTPIHGPLTHNPEPYKGNEDMFKYLPPDDIRRIIEITKDKLISGLKTKEIPPKKLAEAAHKIELVYMLLYNFFLLDEGSENTPDDEQKETNARIGHNFVHNIYFAAEGNASPEFLISIYRMIVFTEWLTKIFSRPGAKTAPIFLKGAKSELAIIKTLKENGFMVYLPDYAQKTNFREKNEVLQLDVKSGIDLIAVSQGTICLINSKGRDVAVPSVEKTDFRLTRKKELLYDTLTKLGGNSGNFSVKPCNIVVPTGDLFFKHRGHFPGIEAYKEELQRYCSLNPKSQSVIIEGLRGL